MRVSLSKFLLSLLFFVYIVTLLINFFYSEDDFGVRTNQLTKYHRELQNHGLQRVFKGKIIFKNIQHHFSQSEMEEVNFCENWVVIVATHKPETVINYLKSLTEAQGSKWCCVVVLDTERNIEKDFLRIKSEKFVVIARKEIKEFVDSYPGYSSVQNVRFHSLINIKNIGYIYAIRHGAKLIFDAHEDYRLTEEKIPYTDSLGEFLLVKSSNNVFNPYKLLRQKGLPGRNVWNLNNFSFEVYEQNNCLVNRREIGVMQFMTKYDGTSERYTEQKFNKLPLVMERGTHMAYSSRATLHHYSSFFGLHLPFTTKDKLADVMRAYYAQRLMRDIGTNIAVAKPLMEHLLAESTLISDEELHMSVPDHLITFLNEWQSESSSLVERMEELAIKFYEKGFWEEEEVYSIQKWIQDLEMAGYRFPKITPEKNEEYFLLQKEDCQKTDTRTPADEQSKNKSDIVTRGKLELFLRMSANRTALLDFYNLIFDWSLRFFWHNEISPLNLMLILDDEYKKDHEIGKEREKVYPYPTVHFEKPNSYYGTNGHSRMQLSMFWADQYATGEYIGFLDTDTLFITLTYEDLLFEGDKPIVWGLFGGALTSHWGKVKKHTYLILKKKEIIKAMSYFPVIVKVKHLAAVRKYIEKVNGKPFNDVFQHLAYITDAYSQFNIIFTYLWYFHKDEYVWRMEKTMVERYDGPNEITDFPDITDEMRVPSPKLSIHYKYIYGKKMKLEPKFRSIIHTEQSLKTRNSLMLEGYCYSYGFKNTPEICTKFDVNAVQQSLYEFEEHSWAWDERCITSQQKHYSSLTDVKHEWDPEILSAISKDLI